MMEVYSVGCAKVEIGDFSLADGTTSNYVEVAVLKDTVYLNESAPTKNKFFKVGSPSPVKIGITPGQDIITMNVIDVSVDTMAKLMGGTVTTVNGVKTYNKAKTLPKEKIMSLKVTTLDGLIFEVPRGSWTVSKNFQMADNQIMFLQCEIEVTDTGFANVPDFKWTQPATT